MRTKSTFLTIGLVLISCLQMQGQEQKRKPWVMRALNAVKTYIDSSAVKGIDPQYLKSTQKEPFSDLKVQKCGVAILLCNFYDLFAKIFAEKFG